SSSIGGGKATDIPRPRFAELWNLRMIRSIPIVLVGTGQCAHRRSGQRRGRGTFSRRCGLFCWPLKADGERKRDDDRGDGRKHREGLAIQAFDAWGRRTAVQWLRGPLRYVKLFILIRRSGCVRAFRRLVEHERPYRLAIRRVQRISTAVLAPP